MVKTLTILTYLLGGLQAHQPLMSLMSPSIHPKGEIPTAFTCQGHDASPPLRWHHVPASSSSLVLIMYDKSAPKSQRYLWALYNIPRSQHWIPSNPPLLRGEHYAKNSWGQLSYHGPCLSSSQGKHDYVIKLYAMKARFYFHKEMTTQALLKAMKHRIITTATLKAHYTHSVRKANPHSR